MRNDADFNIDQVTDAGRNRSYTAKELVQLTREGHFCIRATIDAAIREIVAAAGPQAAALIAQLPSIHAYTSEEEIDDWERRLLEIRDKVTADSVRQGESDPRQMMLFEKT